MLLFYFYFICLVSQLGFCWFVFVVMGGCCVVFCFTESYTAQVGLELSYHPVIIWVYHHVQPLKILCFNSKIYFGNDLNKFK